MTSRCGAHSTSPPHTATRHAASNISKWATMVARIVPTRGRTTPPSSLQVILLTAGDPPPGSNIKEQGISFAAVEVPTREKPSKEQSVWPSGPTGEAVASFDTSELFSGFEGATGENTGSSTFEINEGLIQGLGLWNHITRGLAAIMGLFGAPFNVSEEEAINSGAQTPGTRTHITGTLTTLARALDMTVMPHYFWLTLGSFPHNRVASTNTNGQPVTFGGSTDAEDGLALAAVPAAEKWNRGSNSLVSVMVDSGVSDHYFEDALIPELRYRLDNYQALAIRRWITTAGGHQLKEAGQGLPRGHSNDAQGLERLTQHSVLTGSDAGGTSSRLSKTVPCRGGNRYREPRSAVNHESNLHHLEKRLQLGELHKMAPLNVLSSQCHLAVNTWRHHSQGYCNSNTMDLRATK